VRWNSSNKSLEAVQRKVEVIPDYVPREANLLAVSSAPAFVRAPIHHGVQLLETHLVSCSVRTDGYVEAPIVKVADVPEEELLRYGTKREAFGRKGRMKKFLTVTDRTGEVDVAYSTRGPRVWEGETGSQLIIKGEEVTPIVDPWKAAFFTAFREKFGG
jgi:hypothetical protein